MGTGGWLAFGAGVAMWVTIIAICVFGKPPNGCPSCLHDDAADSRGRCSNFDSTSGWGSDECGCTRPYHRERLPVLDQQHQERALDSGCDGCVPHTRGV